MAERDDARVLRGGAERGGEMRFAILGRSHLRWPGAVMIRDPQPWSPERGSVATAGIEASPGSAKASDSE